MMNSGNSHPGSGFDGLGIVPKLLEVIARLKFTTPTPIQQQAIPIAIEGKDMVGIAQTGTGKTLAFGIPMIQRLAHSKGRGLVLLPTRELAIQVEEMMQKIGKELGLKIAVLIGGTNIGPQLSALSRNPHIIVATPGRLIDHLQQKTVRLDNVNMVVLDEADRMLDMGFAPQIAKVFSALPKLRQTMLFSATMSEQIMKMAAGYMQLPVRVEVAPSGTLADKVTQELFIVHRQDKVQLLDAMLAKHRGPVLIFTRTKYGAAKLVRQVHAMGHTVAELHSNRSLHQRREALSGFKSGKYRVLIATDIASRGIDVANIGLVLNFDMPATPDDYVHRIGRTARAGAGGHAVTFVMPEQRHDVHDIERMLKKSLPVSPVPQLPPPRVAKSLTNQQSRFAPRFNRPYRGHQSHRGSSGRSPRRRFGR